MLLTLDAGPPADKLYLVLVPGKGAFANGVTVGTFPLTGDDADYNNCGVCVQLWADLASAATKTYVGTSGAIQIVSLTAPFQGSGSDLVFREVDTATRQLVSGGCSTSMPAMGFTAM